MCLFDLRTQHHPVWLHTLPNSNCLPPHQTATTRFKLCLNRHHRHKHQSCGCMINCINYHIHAEYPAQKLTYDRSEGCKPVLSHACAGQAGCGQNEAHIRHLLHGNGGYTEQRKQCRGKQWGSGTGHGRIRWEFDTPTAHQTVSPRGSLPCPKSSVPEKCALRRLYWPANQMHLPQATQMQQARARALLAWR